MANFVKWNSLNQFHEVMKAINYRKYSEWLANVMGNKLTYYGKVKMHGTNASVTITPEGKVIAGKRSSFIPHGGVGGDNAGFGAWVARNEEAFLGLKENFEPDVTITVYGEWCGSGVQSNVACSMTDRKMFYVFSVDTSSDDARTRIFEPNGIIGAFPALDAMDDVIVLPFHCKIELDFADASSMTETLANINAEVENIGERDPFMFENFELDGAGEGLVFYPVVDHGAWLYNTPEKLELFSAFNFKAKSEHHRVNKTKSAVSANPEQIAGMKNFGEMFCTTQRFEQGFKEALNEQKDMKLTSEFIKWCCIDVMKESETERELIDIPWEKLSKVVASRAAVWYKAKCQEV